MYISRIRLKNIRCIDDLEISLGSRAATNDSLLLLGNNAVGKSTVLKCIAIGLCDRVGASGLVTDMYGTLIKDGHSQGSIEIDLSRGKKKFRTQTIVKQSPDNPSLEWLNKEPSSDFPWGDVFVCGYGPTRVMHGTNTYSEYAAVDAVYSLFNYSGELQNPELVVRRRVMGNPQEEKRLLGHLSELLMMNPTAVRLSRSGLKVRNSREEEGTFGALADGHRSTLNWMLDLIGWTLLHGRKEPSGIVLIDEIENHLHPTWQRRVLSLVSKHFPRIQFIATSHSALPAAGIYEEKSPGIRIGKVHVLRMSSTRRVVNEELPVISGSTYDQILESSAFDTPPRPVALEKALNAVEAAYSGPRSRSSPKFKRAMEHLREVSPMHAASANEKRIARELDAKLNELIGQRERPDAASD